MSVVGIDDVQNPHQFAPYNGKYVGTIEVIVLRCNQFSPQTPFVVEKRDPTKTTNSKAKFHTKKGQVQRKSGDLSSSSQDPKMPLDAMGLAQVDRLEGRSPARVTGPLYGFDGQWDEPIVGDQRKGVPWGFEMTGLNTGMYKPTHTGLPSQVCKGKPLKVSKGTRTNRTREDRSQAEDSANEARGSSHRATPPAVVINSMYFSFHPAVRICS